MRNKPWDGVGVWSSHPVRSPQQVNRDNFLEMLCVLSWSEEARLAFAKGLCSYNKAGRPGIPLGASNYQATFRKLKRKERADRQTEGDKANG